MSSSPETAFALLIADSGPIERKETHADPHLRDYYLVPWHPDE